MPRPRLRRKRLEKAPKKPKVKKDKKSKKDTKAQGEAKEQGKETSELQGRRKGLAGRLPRPRVPRPSIPRPTLKRPSRPGFIPRDIWFRVSTRVKALGYGAREQAWNLSRWVERRVEVPLAGFWRRRSRGTRIGVLSAAAVLLL